MKRSEMIKIISNYIYELNVDHEECDEKANYLLSLIEKEGMKPPTRFVGLDQVVSIESAIKTNTWEPEDEKK